MKNTMIFGTRVSKKLKDIKHTDQTPKPDGYNLNLTSNKKINDEFARKMMDEQLRAIRIDNQRKLLENEAISFKNAAIDATTQGVKSSTRKMDAETVIMVGQYTVGLFGTLLAIHSSADIIASIEPDAITIPGTETTQVTIPNTTTQTVPVTEVPRLAEANSSKYKSYLDKFRNLVEHLSEPKK
jgi:hypothetical protein